MSCVGGLTFGGVETSFSVLHDANRAILSPSKFSVFHDDGTSVGNSQIF